MPSIDTAAKTRIPCNIVHEQDIQIVHYTVHNYQSSVHFPSSFFGIKFKKEIVKMEQNCMAQKQVLHHFISTLIRGHSKVLPFS